LTKPLLTSRRVMELAARPSKLLVGQNKLPSPDDFYDGVAVFPS
jgi:hypothetical protein